MFERESALPGVKHRGILNGREKTTEKLADAKKKWETQEKPLYQGGKIGLGGWWGGGGCWGGGGGVFYLDAA